MSIGVENPVEAYIGNGVSSMFPVTFTFEGDDISVFLDGTQVFEGFSVNDNGVEFSEAPADEVSVLILRTTDIDQRSSFDDPRRLSIEEVGNALNRVVRQIQEQNEKVSRSVSIPVGSTSTTNIEVQPFTAIAFDEDGNLYNETIDQTIARLGVARFLPRAEEAADRAQNLASEAEESASQAALSEESVGQSQEAAANSAQEAEANSISAQNSRVAADIRAQEALTSAGAALDQAALSANSAQEAEESRVASGVFAAESAQIRDEILNGDSEIDIFSLLQKPIGAVFPVSSNVLQDLAYSEDQKTMFVTQDIAGDIHLTSIKDFRIIQTVNLGQVGHGEGLFFAPYMGKRRLFLADSANSRDYWLISEDYTQVELSFQIVFPSEHQVNGWMKANYCEESNRIVVRYEVINDSPLEENRIVIYEWSQDEVNPIGDIVTSITPNPDYVLDENPIQGLALNPEFAFVQVGISGLNDPVRVSNLTIYSLETGLEVHSEEITLDLDVAGRYGSIYEPEGLAWFTTASGKRELHFGLMMGETGGVRHYIASYSNERTTGVHHFALNMSDDGVAPIFDADYPQQSSTTYAAISGALGTTPGGDGIEMETRIASQVLSCQGDANLTSHGINAAYRYSFNDDAQKEIRMYDMGRPDGTDSIRVGVDDIEIGQNNRIYGSLLF